MHGKFSYTAFRSPAIKLLAAIVIAFSGSRRVSFRICVSLPTRRCCKYVSELVRCVLQLY